MSALFRFALRLFICFLAAKLFLHALGVAGRDYLIGLTLLLTANLYWLTYLAFRDRRAETRDRGPGRENSDGQG
jgi:uncharacterized membrane protein YccC